MFDIQGMDNGKHVVKLADGQIKHLTDDELNELRGSKKPKAEDKALDGPKDTKDTKKPKAEDKPEGDENPDDAK